MKGINSNQKKKINILYKKKKHLKKSYNKKKNNKNPKEKVMEFFDIEI